MYVLTHNAYYQIPHARVISVKNDRTRLPCAIKIDAGKVGMRTSVFQAEHAW